jgi:hypothetical protein
MTVALMESDALGVWPFRRGGGGGLDAGAQENKRGGIRASHHASKRDGHV